MVAINDNDLLILCQYMVLEPPPFYASVSEFLCDVYVTGCRPMELLEVSLWSENLINNEYWDLQPLKGNNVRTFKKTMISDSLNFAITNTIKPYDGITLRQIEYSIKQISPFITVMLLDRYAVVYCNRYNKVRDYLRDGKTQLEITALFGWINPFMSTSYTTRQLYVYQNPIPPETYFVWDFNCNRIIDSNGDFIIDF